MKKLTPEPLMDKICVELLEQLVQKKMPEGFANFLMENASLSHYERVFIDPEETVWTVKQYNTFADLYGLTKEFMEAEWGRMLPFAYDPGGWHFCLCVEDKDYNAVFVNRWTDYPPEEQFLKIADSFEEFIDGLQPEAAN